MDFHAGFTNLVIALMADLIVLIAEFFGLLLLSQLDLIANFSVNFYQDYHYCPYLTPVSFDQD